MRLDAYAERFAAAGYHVLVFDYRHFGASAGHAAAAARHQTPASRTGPPAVGYARSRARGRREIASSCGARRSRAGMCWPWPIEVGASGGDLAGPARRRARRRRSRLGPAQALRLTGHALLDAVRAAYWAGRRTTCPRPGRPAPPRLMTAPEAAGYLGWSRRVTTSTSASRPASRCTSASTRPARKLKQLDRPGAAPGRQPRPDHPARSRRSRPLRRAPRATVRRPRRRALRALHR